MKTFIFIFLLTMCSYSYAQTSKVVTSPTAKVEFFSSAPLEDIKAVNQKGNVALNIETGEILLRLNIKDFEFKKSLMQQHFNEKYLESHLYPNAQFKGKIDKWVYSNTSIAPLAYTVVGTMTIHGVSHPLTTSAIIQNAGGNIIGSANFPIAVADYKVQIPKLLVRNIADTVAVSVYFTAKP